jgi:hypothetical protein
MCFMAFGDTVGSLLIGEDESGGEAGGASLKVPKKLLLGGFFSSVDFICKRSQNYL